MIRPLCLRLSGCMMTLLNQRLPHTRQSGASQHARHVNSTSHKVLYMSSRPTQISEAHHQERWWNSYVTTAVTDEQRCAGGAHEAWSSAPVMSAAGSTPSCVASRASGPSSSSTVTCVISARFFTNPHDSPWQHAELVQTFRLTVTRLLMAAGNNNRMKRNRCARGILSWHVDTQIASGNDSSNMQTHLRRVRRAEHAPLAGLKRARARDLARLLELGVNFGHHAQRRHKGQA